MGPLHGSDLGTLALQLGWCLAVYAVGASLYEGSFRVSAATKNETVWDALLASVNEIRRMQADGPRVPELDKAKGFYAGSYPFKLQGAGEIAGSIVAAEMHGLDVSYVKDFPLRIGAAVTYSELM